MNEPRRSLIIAGLPRSGTTLLSTFLASQARCTFVTDYLGAFSEALDHLHVDWSTALTTTQRRVALAIVRDQLLRFRHPVLVGVDAFSTVAELHALVLEELARPNDLAVGHKLLLSHDRISAILAQTRLTVVVLYRDPRDAAVSYFHRVGTGVEGYLEEWRHTVTLLERTRHPRLFGLRYEDLVRAPERTLRPLFDALRLTLDPSRAALTFNRGPAGQTKWQGNASFEAPQRPFDPSAVERWRTMPDSPIVRYAAWTCRRELARVGYEPGPSMSKREAARWTAHRTAWDLVRRADRRWERGRAQILDLFAPPLRAD